MGVILLAESEEKSPELYRESIHLGEENADLCQDFDWENYHP